MMQRDSALTEATEECNDAMDAFRLAEKRYRYRPSSHSLSTQSKRQQRRSLHRQRAGHQQQQQSDDFSDVIDLHHLDCNTAANQRRIREQRRRAGDGLHADCRLFTIDGCSGLTVMTQALTHNEQLHWAHHCLSCFSNAQHTNLSNLYGPQPDHWRGLLASGDWSAFHSLRWASLGFHYDWTGRRYSAAAQSPFPPSLSALASSLSAAVSVPLVPSAAIVNFYTEHSRMACHLDNAELTAAHPIVSISIGQSAVFLLGSTTRCTAPTALWLRSGDVMLMAGDSRLCYHGVPRVVKDVDWSSTERLQGMDDEELQRVTEYLQSHRINLNVRQVEDENHYFSSRADSD